MIEQKRHRRRDATRQRILAAATEIAADEGWPGVTMRKIADRIDYSHPALYAYFATKEDLLLALLRAGLLSTRPSCRLPRMPLRPRRRRSSAWPRCSGSSRGATRSSIR